MSINLELLQAARDGIDWDGVLEFLIQTYPKEVTEAITTINGNDPLRKTLALAAKGEGKVTCIKFLRQESGMGLKEAKDWVEGNCPQFMG